MIIMWRIHEAALSPLTC